MKTISKPKLLVVWSNYYHDLAQQQLATCETLLAGCAYDYAIERVEAGTYEIPAVIHHYQQTKPYDGYLPLGLLLQGSTDHYDFIWQHVKECFIRFALDGVLIGNGIIAAPTMALLTERVRHGERVQEAYLALDYLLGLKMRQART